ncbi:M23 family metallopeptidase [Williamsia soli]|uniref:M23 family metallopeptidase n=1 Tax=Williamsia soli TaxID=364929 RepID=UPI001F1640CA|nr:M23 family metallopeptidase [Williamsia soli]
MRNRSLTTVFAIGAVTVALVASGCSSPDDDTTETSSTASAFADVVVPEAFTSLTMTAIGDPTFPFLGTDQRYHVAYDLQLTNASPVPATLDRVDVVDGTEPDNVIATFAGAALVDPTCSYGNCNRLQNVPNGVVDTAVIPPRTSRILFLDYTFDSLDDVPKAVLHHVYGTGANSPASREPAPIDYVITPIDISASTPRVISPPLRGDNWIALNGCCEPGFPHRGSALPVDGKLNNSQRFAIDWKRTDDEGAFYVGDRTQNTSYVDYGSDIHAVADATVISVLDDVAANAPGTLPAQDPVLAARLTALNVDGNHIVLDLGDGVYAMYAHLIEGSLLVKPGDRVTDGQVIAKLGNTGNANASHLHFQLMNGPTLLGSDGLPYVFDEFDYAGQVPVQAIMDADDYLTGNFLQDKLPTAQKRTDELPMNLAIVNFPES